jgi:hypothetical protein
MQALIIPPVSDHSGYLDYSDLIASISVWFDALSYIDPDSNWGWNHPVLLEWLQRHGCKSKFDLTLNHYATIDRSLERAYWRIYDVYRSDCAAARSKNLFDSESA